MINNPRIMAAIAISAVIAQVLAFASPQHRPPSLDIDPCRPPGFEIAVGVLTAADHEAAEGYFEIGGLTLLVPPAAVAADRLRELRGKRGTLVFVPEEK